MEISDFRNIYRYKHGDIILIPKFSSRSLSKLKTCHPYLQELFGEVIKVWDCTIIEGQRSLKRQGELLADGKTTIEFSRHNVTPLSWAVDAVPHPIDWNDRDRFCHFAGIVLGIAFCMGIPIRWGGNWKQSKQRLTNTGLIDLPHYELTGPDFKLKGAYI